MPPEYPTSIQVQDLVIGPIMLMIIIFVAFFIRRQQGEEESHYKYFLPGLFVKLFGAISVCFIYLYFYNGGDTVSYFHSSLIMLELMKHNLSAFFDIVINGNLSEANSFAFTSSTGFPSYYGDPMSFFIVRIITPFTLICFKSFFATSMLFTFISYSGIWKLYTVFVEEFPTLKKEMAIAVLFVPSVFFWGSGILKDPVTISATGWFTYAIYKLGIQRRLKLQYLIFLIISSYLMLSIKPYILYALLPSTAIWLLHSLLKLIKSDFIKRISYPVLLTIFASLSYVLIMELGKDRSKFSVNNLMQLAITTQTDLKRDEYGGASFNLGNFDATAGSMLSKAPLAINYALFRPYIWEARNTLMLFSGIENMLILMLTLYLLLRKNIFSTIRMIQKNALVLFSLSYSIMFAFSVGLSTSNFGSLVRYKIPSIPFFVASLFIIRYLYIKAEQEKKKAAEISVS